MVLFPFGKDRQSPQGVILAGPRGWGNGAEPGRRIGINLQRAGQATVDEVSAAEYYRSEAELWLLQAKVKFKVP